MKLARREIITVSLGAAIAVAALGYRWMNSSSAGSPAEDTFSGALGRIEEHESLARSVDRLKDDLSVTVASLSIGEQEKKIREDLSSRADQQGLRMSSIRRIESSSRGKKGTDLKPIQFRIELLGRYGAMMTFLERLESSQQPYVVKEIQMEASTKPSVVLDENQQNGAPPPPPNASLSAGVGPGAGGGGGAGKGKGSVRATVKLQTYLFPEVIRDSGSKPSSGASTKKTASAPTGDKKP